MVAVLCRSAPACAPRWDVIGARASSQSQSPAWSKLHFEQVVSRAFRCGDFAEY